MRTLVLLLISLVFVCSCGEQEDQNDIATSRPTNLFSIQVDRKSEVNTDIVLGLWESTPYVADDSIKQIRWSVDENSMTLAKQCTYMGRIYVAQVSMPIKYAPAVAIVNEDGTLNDPQNHEISAKEVDFPKPQVIQMKNGKVCEAGLQLSQEGEGQYVIEDDKEFIFSGEIENGAIEMQFLSDGTVGSMNKVQD